MILHMKRSVAAIDPVGGIVCADCGASASGNFCSTCGADLRENALGILGAVAAPVRRSFPAVYLKLLRAPVRQTVALAEDPTYRAHVSFLLTGIAIFCLLFVPILMHTSVPATGAAPVSESMQNVLKVLSQVGVYVGSAITFGLAFGLFRYFAQVPRTFNAYFKLYCMAFGFVMPLYAAYEFVTRGLLDGIGMSSFNGPMTEAQWMTPTALVSVALALLLWGYFVAIHRRFWSMPVWKATVLYVIAAVVSYKLSFWLMFYVGYFTVSTLISSGLLRT